MPTLKRARRIQSLLFPKDRFSAEQAKAWAEKRGYTAREIDTVSRFHRLHMFEPSCCKQGTLKPIPLPGSGGIEAAVCEIQLGRNP